MERKKTFVMLGTVIAVLSLVLMGCPSTSSSSSFNGIIFDEGLGAGLKAPAYWNGDNGFAQGDDTTDPHDGTLSLKVDWSAVTDWNGLALEAEKDSGEKLSAYDALTFYAKAEAETQIDKFGFAAGSAFEAYLFNQNITTEWVKYIVPIPDASKLTAVTNIFFVADGAGAVIYLDVVKYEKLGNLTANAIAAPSSSTVSVEAGKTSSVVISSTTFNDGTADHVVTGNTEGGKSGLTSYLTWSSADDSIATVDDSGVISGVAAGSTTITGALGGQSVDIAVTVSEATEPVVFNGVIYDDALQNGFVAKTGIGTSAGHADIAATIDSTVSVGTGTNSVFFDLSTSETYGGGYFQNDAGVDVSGYTNLVFSIDKSAFDADIDFMELKVESTADAKNDIINLFGETPVTVGNWETYTVPLTKFTTIDLDKFKALGFWNPRKPSEVEGTPPEGAYTKANF